MARRSGHPESWWWETQDGHQWLTRLVGATLYTFSLTRGVGRDTREAFFVRLHLATQVGWSPSVLRRVMQTLDTTIRETTATWEKHEVATGGERAILGAVDETFLEQMVLVFMDLPTGYSILEETADERSYATWHALVAKRLTALKAQGRSLGSDRAKARIHLAAKGLECLRMPDCLHLVHDLVQSDALALGRPLHQARQEVSKAEEKLHQHPKADTQDAGDREAPHQVEATPAEGRRWDAIQTAYRHHRATLSLTLHPVGIAAAAPQTSTPVVARVQAQVEAREALARTAPFPARPAAMAKVKKPLPAVAALVDCWWQGVRRDGEHAAISPLGQRWAQEVWLPQRSWERQVRRTRCTRRKAKMRGGLAKVRSAFDAHVLPRALPPEALQDWHAWATQQVDALQRASAAVEGRNGSLAGMPHQQQGLPTRRDKVWTGVHNFAMRAADGTTPAARFFRRAFPDLFATVLANVGAFPQPRQRKRVVMLRP